MVVLMLVAGSLYLTYVFSYLYLWTVNPQVWPPTGSPPPPSVEWATSSAALLIASVVAFVAADRLLPAPQSTNPWAPALMLIGAGCLVGGVVVEIDAHWQTGLRATKSSYAAMVYMESVLTGELAFTVAIMTAYGLARYFTGKMDCVRRVTFECAAPAHILHGCSRPVWPAAGQWLSADHRVKQWKTQTKGMERMSRWLARSSTFSSGPIVWAIHLTLVYLGHTLLCALGVSSGALAPGVVSFSVIIVTAVALAVLVVAVVAANFRVRAFGHRGSGRDRSSWTG